MYVLQTSTILISVIEDIIIPNKCLSHLIIIKLWVKEHI